MDLLPSLLLASVLAPLATPALPPDPDGGFSRVRSPRFDVLTDTGAPLAAHVAERLEVLRVALERLLPPRLPGERRTVVLVLASGARFEALVPRHHRRPRDVAGFFLGGGEQDVLVARLGTGRRGPYVNVEHEYAHLALNRSLPAQPVWVAEGLAEMLSDAVIEAGEVRLGGRLEGLEGLAREADVPLDLLLRVRHDSPEYTGVAAGALLYARSWALARWAVARHGLDRLRTSLEAVAEGGDVVAAFEAHLAPLAEARAALFDVPAGPLFRAAVSREAGGGAPLLADVPRPAEIDHLIGAILLEGGDAARARARFERALAAEPDHVGARVALAGLHVGRGEWAAARGELEHALALAPADPAALVADARLWLAEARSVGTPLAPAVEARLADWLETALARAPDLYEAALLLAELRPEPVARRLAALLPAFERDPGQTDLGRTIAALLVKQRDLAAARRVLFRARDAARDPAHRFLCQHLLDQLGGYVAATAEVRGRLRHLDCRADGSLRFTVHAPAGILRLEAPTARSFLVYGEGEASGERELTCGPQDRALVVRYQRSADEGGVLQGSVLWLAFSGPSHR